MKQPPIVMHPNGFLQYTLPSGGRLHVWHPDAPQAQKVYTPIHDHTFSFVSRVILGELVETVYDWWPREGYEDGNTPEETGDEYQLWAATGEGTLAPTINVGQITKRSVHHYLPGQRYERQAGIFHKTEAGGEAKYAATVMNKIATDLTPYPQVAIPLGVQPDNEFRRDQYQGDVLWPLVKDAVDYLYSHSIAGIISGTFAGPERFGQLTGREDARL